MQERNQNQCSTAKNDVKQRARRIMRRACFLWYGDAGSLSCYVSDSISMAPFALSTDKTDSMIGIRAADSCSLHSSIINRSWRIAGLSLFISGLKISLESSLSARTKGYRKYTNPDSFAYLFGYGEDQLLYIKENICKIGKKGGEKINIQQIELDRHQIQEVLNHSFN